MTLVMLGGAMKRVFDSKPLIHYIKKHNIGSIFNDEILEYNF